MKRALPLSGTIFLEGPAGCGKTTEAADYLRRLLDSNIAPERILVVVPQRTLGRKYQEAAYKSKHVGSVVETTTLSGIAYHAISRYWPLLATSAGFADPTREPTFLTIETAQYYMARFADPAILAGDFSGVSISPARVISQTFDNLNKSALLNQSVADVTAQLIGAWGVERHSSRPAVYDASRHLADQFRTYCLENNLIDFSLAMSLFSQILIKDRRFSAAFFERYAYLIADNIEEDHPSAHDFIAWALPHVDGALVIYDDDAGYRVFLGADTDSAYTLAEACDHVEKRETLYQTSAPMLALIDEFKRQIGSDFSDTNAPDIPDTPPDSDATVLPPKKSARKPKRPITPLDAFEVSAHSYYPQMIAWTVEKVIHLVNEKNVPPREIVIVAPYLNDSLRFSLVYPLEQAGIPTLTHRPSRALRDEAPVRTMLTLARLAYPSLTDLPPPADVADALSQAIAELDPVRARLLTGAAYGAGRAELTSFDAIDGALQARIGYRLGARYEQLRLWIGEQTDLSAPLDHFWQRLFGKVLAQPGFGFHTNVEAGRLIAQLIESARTFRDTLYPTETSEWAAARTEYLKLTEEGLLASLYAQSWQDESVNAVFISPAYTFLLRNRFVEHQFWLDIGSGAWAERLEQPLTHPYVLRRDYPAGQVWTDDNEDDTRRAMLFNVIVGLARRCRKQIHVGVADLGEEGFEQRGTLLNIFQRILQRHAPADVPEVVAQTDSTPTPKRKRKSKKDTQTDITTESQAETPIDPEHDA